MKALMLPTNNGKGFKLKVGNDWLYASKSKVETMIKGERKGVQFSNEFPNDLKNNQNLITN